MLCFTVFVCGGYGSVTPAYWFMAVSCARQAAAATVRSACLVYVIYECGAWPQLWKDRCTTFSHDVTHTHTYGGKLQLPLGRGQALRMYGQCPNVVWCLSCVQRGYCCLMFVQARTISGAPGDSAPVTAGGPLGRVETSFLLSLLLHLGTQRISPKTKCVGSWGSRRWHCCWPVLQRLALLCSGSTTASWPHS